MREPIPNLMLSNAIRPGGGRLGEDARPRAGAGRDHRQHHRAGQDRHASGFASLWQHWPDPEEAKARDIAAIPVRRIGTPEEIGGAVAFLCSQQAGYISGVVLAVDGGALRGIW